MCLHAARMCLLPVQSVVSQDIAHARHAIRPHAVESLVSKAKSYRHATDRITQAHARRNPIVYNAPIAMLRSPPAKTTSPRKYTKLLKKQLARNATMIAAKKPKASVSASQLRQTQKTTAHQGCRPQSRSARAFTFSGTMARTQQRWESGPTARQSCDDEMPCDPCI